MEWRQRDCNRGDRYLWDWSNTRSRSQGYSRKNSITFAVGTFDVFWGTGLDKEATLSTKNNKLPGKDRLGLLYQKLDNKHTGMLRSSSLPSLILKSSREIFGSKEKRPTSVTRATITSKSTNLTLELMINTILKIFSLNVRG